MSSVEQGQIQIHLPKLGAMFQRLRQNPKLKIARRILEEHGQNSLEYFKLGADKKLFFSKSQKSFLAYKIFGSTVMVLGDPVGPYQEIEKLVATFNKECIKRKKTLAFFQVSSFLLDIYQRLGLQLCALGAEGFVELNYFDIRSEELIQLKEQMRVLDSYRYKVRYYKNPNNKQLINKLEAVSQAWLEQGEPERVFSAGAFSETYIKDTTVMTVEDLAGNVVAFLSIVPSCRKNEAGIDLIRVSNTAPESCLEYLLTNTILFFKELAYQRLSLGLVAIAEQKESKSFDDAITKSLLSKLQFLFADRKLLAFKKKFISFIEKRYFACYCKNKIKAQANSAPKAELGNFQDLVLF